jgi:6-phosphogluconate dehydrogenase
MSTIEIKQELHNLINQGDDKMIAESEEDIKAGRIHSQDEVQKIIESWRA